MRKIVKIEQTVPTLPKKKRVAAYARVSMETDRLMHSLTAQISHYSELIQKNPAWEYAGVYADNFVSGTDTKKRDNFRRMIADCEAGHIDIILCKSISRFARNTVDLLETVRHLKELGIEVRFEKEKINSLSGDGELMLTILASFAQEESRSLSENVKWAIRKGYEQGKVRNTICYGYRLIDGKLQIEPSEAEVVRQIFEMYLLGDSCYVIAEKLNAANIQSYYGKKFSTGVINGIIRQEKYTGNTLMQKYFTESSLTHKERRNKGELPMYLAHDTHPAIISQELFDAVQLEISRRYGVPIVNGIAERDTYMHHPKGNKKPKSRYPRRKAYWSEDSRKAHAEIYKSRATFQCLHYDLSLFIKCEICGQNLTAKIRHYADGTSELWWECFKHRKASPNTKAPRCLQDIALKSQIASVLGISEFDTNEMVQSLSHISITGEMLTFHFHDGNSITQVYVPNKRKYRRKVKTDE